VPQRQLARTPGHRAAHLDLPFPGHGGILSPKARSALAARALGPARARRGKRIHLGQRQLILRADAYNAFNQDNYGIPVLNMSNTAFGTNTGGLAPDGWGRRIITLSAKFIW
jgi:hypothetical protein